MNELIKRLEVIQLALSLSDKSLINSQLEPLISHPSSSHIQDIIDTLQKAEFNHAHKLINEFITKKHGLIEIESIELSTLKLELIQLDESVQCLRDNIGEITLIIDDFNKEHQYYLGELISEILGIKKQIADLRLKQFELKHHVIKNKLSQKNKQINEIKEKIRELEQLLETTEFFSDEYETIKLEINSKSSLLNQAKIEFDVLYEKAKIENDIFESSESVKQAREEQKESENDYKKYHAENDDEQIKRKPQSEEAKKRLKELYRKASRLCHPDKVKDDMKSYAHELMVEINKAYNTGDIERLQELLMSAENGFLVKTTSFLSLDIHQLKQSIKERKATLASLSSQLTALETDSTWCLIQTIANWKEYFDIQIANLEQTKIKLMSVSQELSLSIEQEKITLEEELKHNHLQNEVAEPTEQSNPIKNSTSPNDSYWNSAF
ncbi:hypothetical protein [Thorsellia anophelis]|uniref:DnaJ domain-containing protein n=1 Tax=Thorsellia anophelis DSM 18579 TaxID=1123402 RepID=A0A1I0CF26_9GAMM|nr:hypothetical protein [Thorsellia anophelis]SET17704.1 hypothetical protein SAMN02583745_01601 [Thorsellia anophelis DSM 18579]